MTAIFNVISDGQPVDIAKRHLQIANTPLPIGGAGNDWLVFNYQQSAVPNFTPALTMWFVYSPPADTLNSPYGLYINYTLRTDFNYGGLYNSAILLTVQHTGTGTVSQLYGLWITDGLTSGTVTSYAAVYLYGYNDGGGTVNGSRYEILMLPPIGTGTTINEAGIAMSDMAQKSTNSSNVILGATTIPPSLWSIYNVSSRPNYSTGPQIDVAVKKRDDFNKLTWGATTVWAVGYEWRATISAGGSITQVTPARGGIIDIFATLAAGANSPTFLDEANVLGWSLQDRPLLYTKWRVVQVADTRSSVGWTDDVNEAAGDPMPYTMNAVLVMVDTAVGNFYYLVGVRAGARTNVSSTVAIDTNHHRFMILPKYTNVGVFDGMNLWVDGVYKCSLTAAQCPVEATMMQCLSGYTQNLAVGAVANHQRVDKVVFGVLTNTGTGDT